MINHLKNKEIYKITLSVMLGFIGFVGAFYSTRLNFNEFYINFPWSIILPLLVSLAWGPYYGVISISLGLTILYPFVLGYYNGWASLVPLSSLYIWIIIHGYGGQKRLEKDKFYYNVYFVQLIYVIIRMVIYVVFFPILIKFNPPFWNPEAYTQIEISIILLFAIKGIIVESILVALADAILLLPPVKRMFGLEYSASAKYNTRIMMALVIFGLMFTLVILIVQNFIIDQKGLLEWIIELDEKTMITFVLSTILFFIMSGITVRFVEKVLEAQESLRIREAQYHTIFEGINDLYIETELNGIILIASPSAKEILNYEAEELVGVNIKELYYHPNENDNLIDIVLDKKEINNYEIIVKDKNGKKRWLWFHAKISSYKEGEHKIISVARDVTQYVEAINEKIKSEGKYKVLYEKMLNGFIIFKPVHTEYNELIDIRYIDVNPGFEEQSKMNKEDLIGKTWSEIYGYQNQHLDVFRRVLKTGNSEGFEVYSAEKNLYFLFNAFVIDKDYIGLVSENITPYKKAIKEIQSLNNELEQRVIDRTAELQSVVSELEGFSYTISHDLKSPLRAIDGYSQFIMEDYGKTLDSEVVEMIKSIQDICKDMIGLINELLEYSITSKANIHNEPVNVKQIILTVFREFEIGNPERKIQLCFDNELPIINGDRVLLKQAITNIIANAIKFSKDREITIISVGSNKTDNEYMFYVKDNGVGFDMKYSNKLFGIFQRLHRRDDFEGAGIGLATVRKVLEKHGGKVWIEGVLNEGTTVYFTLPVKAEIENEV
ncbi:ATP-binding protein [Natronincola ferrireducens]|uniref:histidine kinase n=1 Tax=Natronincola ferrireducens TaxID=393762 RepID=A0A1G9A9S4_9FIRM|nr:ATP-binding protein [Natronincola ferrireducens]SDK24116.1 PAS domain S-box-containing protein [Natronincola ferrireducens]